MPSPMRAASKFGARRTDLLNPINLVEQAHAIILAGGSAFGLDAASGAMRYLFTQTNPFKYAPSGKCKLTG